MLALNFMGGLGFPQHTLASLQKISNSIIIQKTLEPFSAALESQNSARRLFFFYTQNLQ